MHPLVQLHHILVWVLQTAFAVGFFGGLLYMFVRASDNPKHTVIKLVISIVVIGGAAWFIKPYTEEPFNMIDLVLVMICAFTMIILWRHEIGALFARPLESLYTGGDVEPDPQPYYSIAEARRKLGRYPEAVTEIRKQLEKFPTDFTGQMMLAEIQAQNLDDLPGAELTINRIVSQPHAPINIAHALSTLADWHLKYTLDRDAARSSLERIIELIPGTEQALVAEQRIAKLASTEKLVAVHDRQKYAVREGVQNIGLLKPEDMPKPDEADMDKMAAGYVKHLTDYPLDFEVREKLALIYADHFHRLDLATDQIEQMIGAENQPPKKIIHWINLLADLQIRHGADYPTVERTLERILDLFPNLPEAQVTRNRLSHLKLEFRAQTKGKPLKMGTYEQNIGLKQSPKHY
jgi:tetratricopeptide (TPR) repeat protein